MTTDTTREGFVLPEMPNFMRAWNPITVNQVHAYGQQCYAAAKADELAFLEGLVRDPQWFYSRITDRIAALKGETK